MEVSVSTLEESPAIPDFVVGDFNQDGALDVVTSQGGSDEVARIFLGNGDATFAAPTTTDLGLFSGGLIVGDFNGDGKLDILGAAEEYPGGNKWRLALVAGNGDGTFQPPTTVGTFPFPQNGSFFLPSYYVNDFNKDGKLDIAFANFSGQVGILLGNGDGTFQSAVYYTVGSQTYFTFVVGDFNSDGDTDILVQQYAVNTSLSILLGNGDGTFQNPQVLLPAGLFPEVVFGVADFNSDGLLDLSAPPYDNIYLQQ
ncbi:MAG: FG-GAP repeat domain-containing protein [Candidatus Sulfotelmatobacter sp.]